MILESREATYSFLYRFSSNSGFLTSGVHLGVSCAKRKGILSLTVLLTAPQSMSTDLEEPHSSNSVVAIEGEAVEDASRHDNQVVLLDLQNLQVSISSLLQQRS
jgi:hypothetical protein